MLTTSTSATFVRRQLADVLVAHLREHPKDLEYLQEIANDPEFNPNRLADLSYCIDPGKVDAMMKVAGARLFDVLVPEARRGIRNDAAEALYRERMTAFNHLNGVVALR